MCQTLTIFCPRGGAGQGLEGRRDEDDVMSSCWYAPAKPGPLMFFLLYLVSMNLADSVKNNNRVSHFASPHQATPPLPPANARS